MAVDGQVRLPSVFASIAGGGSITQACKNIMTGPMYCTCSPRQMLLREIAISRFAIVFIYLMVSPEETSINVFEVICVIVVISCYKYCPYFLFDILFSYITLTGTFPWMNVLHLGIKP